MIEDYNLDIKLTDLTLRDLLAVIDTHFDEHSQPARRIKGIRGLADYLGCSLRTAQELKSSGKIDKAITQSGRTIVFDERELRRLLRVK